MSIREKLRAKALSKSKAKTVPVEIEVDEGKVEEVSVIVRELGWGERQEMFGAVRTFVKERGLSPEDVDGSMMIGVLLVYACELEDGTPLFEIDEMFELYESPEPFLEDLMEAAVEVNPFFGAKADDQEKAEGKDEEQADEAKAEGNDDSASKPVKKSPRSRRRKRRR